jgi:hypothetical protein
MRLITFAIAAAFVAAPASAHHGWSAYDASKQQNVTGTVTELKWEQPHGIVWIDSGGKRLEVWLSPIQRMVDRGLMKDALSTGKTITIDAQPSTVNKDEWKAHSITIDGKTVDLMR